MKLSRKELAMKAEGLLDTVNLRDDSKRKASEFSDAMRQRRGIAEVLLNNPSCEGILPVR